MNRSEISDARSLSAPGIQKGPIWPLLLPFALGTLLRLWALPSSVNLRFFPQAEGLAAPDGTRIFSAILFGLVVLTVAWISRELGGGLAGSERGNRSGSVLARAHFERHAVGKRGAHSRPDDRSGHRQHRRQTLRVRLGTVGSCGSAPCASPPEGLVAGNLGSASIAPKRRDLAPLAPRDPAPLSADLLGQDPTLRAGTEQSSRFAGTTGSARGRALSVGPRAGGLVLAPGPAISIWPCWRSWPFSVGCGSPRCALRGAGVSGKRLRPSACRYSSSWRWDPISPGCRAMP